MVTLKNLERHLMRLVLALVISAFIISSLNLTEASHNDDEEFQEWSRESTKVRDRINDLDDEEVENLPIPILFGVSVDDLIPNFGDPRDGGARIHEGLDMAAPEGTPIVSPTEAVVTRIGEGDRSGIFVRTANPGNETFVYMHLEGVADIDEGDVLDRGDIIGYVGDTGNAAGGAAHLHFEVREGREAKDPFSRLTEELRTEEKMEFLENIFRDVDGKSEFAEFLVSEFLNEFIIARTEGVVLPLEIVKALPVSIVASPSGVPAIDLSLGASGPDVAKLQSILMAEGYLNVNSPTGYFGPLTQDALIKYQLANGITPASGYYGPVTRSHMANITDSGDGDMSREQLVARIAELTALVMELQGQLEEQQN